MLELDERLTKLFKDRYFQEGETSLADVLRRVSKFVANNEKEAKEYLDSMLDGYWLPSTPVLMNAGTKFPMCSACFGLDVEDSINSIFETLKRTANIFKLGGGVGINFSKIREKDSRIASSGGKASGVISWMRMFDKMIDEVKQGGKRRGAMIGILNYNHPDIREFINCKGNGTQMTNFNLSVMVDDEFMTAIFDNKDIDLISPASGEVVGKLNAKELYTEIVEHNWRFAEPALLFRDNINKYNPFREIYGDVVTCNPCGEIPLYPNGCCALASINLSKLVKNGKFDFNLLEKICKITYKFMNTLFDKQIYPDELIKKEVLSKRQLGIGICGLHDALIKMNIPYGSLEGRTIAKDIMNEINLQLLALSREESHTKGTFPDWKLLPEGLEKEAFARNNWELTTIAPTGTLSQIIGYVSSGCEPEFSLAYSRKMNMADGTIREDFIVAPILREYCEQEHIRLTDEVLKRICNNFGQVHGLDDIFTQEQQEVLRTAQEITPDEHIKMQACLQEVIGNSISKTINLPNHATVQDIYDLYIEAWRSGIKGTTVYRDGSLDSQVLSTGATETKNVSRETIFNTIEPVKRSTLGITSGKTYPMKSSCGKMYITVNTDEEGNIVEIFINTSKGGICQANTNAVARLCSLALKAGVKVEAVIEELRGIICPACVKNRENCNGTSCPDIIGRAMNESIKKEEVVKTHGETCPECGSSIEHDSGCVICPNCGWSKCS